jgi:hypothetical protein
MKRSLFEEEHPTDKKHSQRRSRNERTTRFADGGSKSSDRGGAVGVRAPADANPCADSRAADKGTRTDQGARAN